MAIAWSDNLLVPEQFSPETTPNYWNLTRWSELGDQGLYINGLAGGSVPMFGAYCLELYAYGVPQMWSAFTPWRIDLEQGYMGVPAKPGYNYLAQCGIRSYWATSYAYVILEWRNGSGYVMAEDWSSPWGPYWLGTDWSSGVVQAECPSGLGIEWVTLAMYVVETYDTVPTYLDGAYLLEEIRAFAGWGVPIGLRPVVQASVTLEATADIDVQGPFEPLDLGTDLYIWADFDDNAGMWQDYVGGSPVTADGQTCAAYQNQSGSQWTGDWQGGYGTDPTWETGVLGGKAALRFTMGGLYNGSSSLLYNWTLFITAKKRSAVGSSQSVWAGSSFNTYIYTDSAESTGYNIPGVGAIGGTPTNSSVIAVRISSSTVAKAWVNGGAGTQWDPVSAWSTTSEHLLGMDPGTTGQGDFDIGDYIVCSRALTDAEMNQVGSYLASRRGASWAGVS